MLLLYGGGGDTYLRDIIKSPPPPPPRLDKSLNIGFFSGHYLNEVFQALRDFNRYVALLADSVLMALGYF